MADLDLGHLVEGTLKKDPSTSRYTLECEDIDGKALSFDVSSTLDKYVGKDVRFIMVPCESIAQIEALAQGGE